MALVTRRGIEALARAVLGMGLAKFAKQAERMDAADGGAPPPSIPGAAAIVRNAKANIRGASRVLATKIQRHSQGEFKRLGIDLRKGEPSFAKQIDAWRAVNVERVSTLLEFERDELADILSKGWGKTVEELRGRIEERLDVSRNKADLLARDQVLTLNSQISHGRMAAAGITQAIWCTSQDERVRASHELLDGQQFDLDDPPEVEGEKALPGEPVMCFPGESEVQFAHDVKKAYRRWYDGELAEVSTDSGKSLRATPNHPVLTLRGWLPLGSLDEGDYLIEVAEELLQSSEKHTHNRVPLISEVFQAAAGVRTIQSTRMHLDDFHGDGANGDVDVVLTARPLFVDVVSTVSQSRCELDLSVSNDSGFRKGNPVSALGRVLTSALSFVGSACKRIALLWGHPGHAQQLCFANTATLDSSLDETLSDDSTTDAESPRYRKFALSSGVIVKDRNNVDLLASRGRPSKSPIGDDTHRSQTTRQVVLAESDDIGRFPERLPFRQQASRVVKARRIDRWVGHVYNLETAVGWYVTNGIVTHNCRCVSFPILPELEED